MDTSGQIFTTKGWLPADEVVLKPTITDSPECTVTRTDKFLASTGEWVGNDLHVAMKKGIEALFEQGKLG